MLKCLDFYREKCENTGCCREETAKKKKDIARTTSSLFNYFPGEKSDHSVTYCFTMNVQKSWLIEILDDKCSNELVLQDQT